MLPAILEPGPVSRKAQDDGNLEVHEPKDKPTLTFSNEIRLDSDSRPDVVINMTRTQAVQIPPLTKHPPTKVSCSTWVKNTEDSNCSHKALGNWSSLRRLWHCQITTMQPMRLLQEQYTTPRPSCLRYLSGQTTARYQTAAFGTLS